ncbi:uncharacterized protein Dana_GF10719, isoform C [Drosophila ananassae]|uniref:E3 ubiquitin-protein ligase n=1 Tax=Drosophila ananassae TaxID=7217 RepID=A0A0N8P134_DROAN|nr:E3 ubiquitin-protein ligase rnf146 isoform X3 [Drosophila ananassae]KPU78812.1 uncharacterized protein Dana_GF10719, isoform C [Drosophila ananassae]
MSQQRASEQNAASNNAVVNLDDGDDEEDEDVQFVGVVRPMTSVIDLCLSPSTSAAAAARAAAGAAGDAVTPPPPAPSSPGQALKATAAEEAPPTSAEESAAPLECPICLQTCIHPARLPCGHIFCFLCVKGVAYKNRRCAMCRREIPAEFLDHPQLVNGIEDICATRATEDGYQWYYEGRNGGWWAYDPRTNDDIEAAYAGYLNFKSTSDEDCFLVENEPLPSGTDDYDTSDEDGSSSENLADIGPHPGRLHIQICGAIYVIDFLRMTQYPRSDTLRRRNIIRRKTSGSVPGVTKGVAGLSKNQISN